MDRLFRVEEAVQLLLLPSDIDVNLQDKFGKTALMAAFGARKMFVMEHLLRHGANTSLKDRDGQTVLHYAAGSPKGTKLLHFSTES